MTELGSGLGRGVMLAALFLTTAISAWAQYGGAPSNPQVELANLRQEVGLLREQIGEMRTRLDELAIENNRLRQQAASGREAYATVAQLNAAIADLNQSIRAAAAQSKSETLAQVSKQMGELARQTNASIDSLARGLATRATVTAPTFTDDFAKEGVTYTVQRGDTISSIAQKFGVSSRDVINANRIVDPTKIQVGQSLFIPGGKLQP